MHACMDTLSRTTEHITTIDIKFTDPYKYVQGIHSLHCYYHDMQCSYNSCCAILYSVYNKLLQHDTYSYQYITAYARLLAIAIYIRLYTYS